MCVLLLPVALHNLPAQQPTGPGSGSTSGHQAEEPIPVDVAPEPTDPVEREVRATRNWLQNRPSALPRFRPDPDNTGPLTARRTIHSPIPVGPPSVVFVDRAPLPELPVKEADTIILGPVSKVQSYLSEDETTVYTEFSVLPGEVLRDANHVVIATASVITLYQIGGALRMPSGRVVRMDVRGLPPPPAENHRYVFFLKYDPRGHWFAIVKTWEIRDGAAVPTDSFDIGQARSGRSHYAGESEAEFLSAVSDAVAQAGGHQ